MKHGDEYQMHVISGDSTYCRINTEEVFKGNPGDPIVEGTTFGWTVHGGEFQSDGVGSLGRSRIVSNCIV